MGYIHKSTRNNPFWLSNPPTQNTPTQGPPREGEGLRVFRHHSLLRNLVVESPHDSSLGTATEWVLVGAFYTWRIIPGLVSG